jgi:transposase
MRTPTKFIQELTNEQKSRLQAIMKSDAPQRTRMRAHAVLLSARRFSIDQIAAIYEADRDRVSQWLQWWKQFEFDGLADDERAGRPPKLSVEEQGQVLEMVRAEPRSVRQAVAQTANQLKKK